MLYVTAVHYVHYHALPCLLLVYLEFCRFNLPDALPSGVMNSFSKSQKGSSVICDDDTRPVWIDGYNSDSMLLGTSHNACTDLPPNVAIHYTLMTCHFATCSMEKHGEGLAHEVIHDEKSKMRPCSSCKCNRPNSIWLE